MDLKLVEHAKGYIDALANGLGEAYRTLAHR